MKISIVNNNTVKSFKEASNKLEFMYNHEYVEGDEIHLEVENEGFYHVQLEDTMPKTLVYAKGSSILKIPFAEKKVSYNQKSFTGNAHFLFAQVASDWEVSAYKKLSQNPFDSHDNIGMFPHSKANVETRGEAVFASRNAIDGNTASSGHGNYPFESWGINQRPDAEMVVEFGRSVLVDRVVITIRTDFPHDNWWKEVCIAFSSGKEIILNLEQTDSAQNFQIEKEKCDWVKICNMKKDETNASPFPALAQIEYWGFEA